jgi:hypothetical protein
MANVDVGGRPLSIGQTVEVLDNWNDRALGKTGEITEIQDRPHHAVKVRMPDGYEAWVLSELVRIRKRMETQPMKENELGRYVCVAHGGCLHSPHRTIHSDGVWVRQAPGGPFSSAHRDCFEAWQRTERGE